MSEDWTEVDPESVGFGTEPADEETDLKEWRHEHPTGWLLLVTRTGACEIIDALLRYEYEEAELPWTKTDVEEFTGLSHSAVHENVDILVEVGVLEDVSEGRWSRYEPVEDSSVLYAVRELSDAVARET